MRFVRAFWPVLLALAGLVAFGAMSRCEDQPRRVHGFSGIGVSFVGGPQEESFRNYLEYHHMAPNDVKCMVEAAYGSIAPGEQQPDEWTEEQLEAMAEGCSIDVSALWTWSD